MLTKQHTCLCKTKTFTISGSPLTKTNMLFFSCCVYFCFPPVCCCLPSALHENQWASFVGISLGLFQPYTQEVLTAPIKEISSEGECAGGEGKRGKATEPKETKEERRENKLRWRGREKRERERVKESEREVVRKRRGDMAFVGSRHQLPSTVSLWSNLIGSVSWASGPRLCCAPLHPRPARAHMCSCFTVLTLDTRGGGGGEEKKTLTTETYTPTYLNTLYDIWQQKCCMKLLGGLTRADMSFSFFLLRISLPLLFSLSLSHSVSIYPSDFQISIQALVTAYHKEGSLSLWDLWQPVSLCLTRSLSPIPKRPQKRPTESI